ncbi:MAG: MFS transporter [Prochloraceae cyanobacterium]|nr:MFS transporter [Prochloraceae cyanobacterium]
MKHSQRWVEIALFLCVFLALFTEVLLSPFYPQFFSKVFGVKDLSYTGYYIFVCRLTIVLCAPIWGFLSQRFEVKHLLYIGQAGTAIFTAMMATARNEQQFLIITILLLSFKSSYLLVYPLIIQLAATERRSTITGIYQAVFHGAIVSATIVGAWMVNLDAPLFLFYWIAIADILQLCLCIYTLGGISSKKSEKNLETKTQVGDSWGFILAIGLVILTFQLANNLVRPYFTAYVTQSDPFGVSLLTSSVLFVIPNLMAIAAMPFIRKVGIPKHLPTLYTVGICLLIIGLYFQGFSPYLSILILSRIVYGFFLAVSQAALELQLFGNSSQKQLHFNYSLATSFANVGHLGAPLFASSLVSKYSLASPLIAAATVCIFNLAFARLTIFKTVSIAQKTELKIQPQTKRSNL